MSLLTGRGWEPQSLAKSGLVHKGDGAATMAGWTPGSRQIVILYRRLAADKMISMTRIILTAEQIDLLAKSQGPIVFVDATGRQVAEAQASRKSKYFSDERIADAKARLKTDGPGITTAELLAKLRALESQ